MLEIFLHFEQVILFFNMAMNFLLMIDSCLSNHWSIIFAIFKPSLSAVTTDWNRVCVQSFVSLVWDLVEDVGEVSGAFVLG
jgi:hypothetical protein